MILAVILLPNAILLACLVLGTMFDGRFRARWWLLRLGLVPLLCFAAAGYVMMVPAEIPRDEAFAGRGNPGRLDFLAILAWGLVFPLVYLTAALPSSLAYAMWKRRR